MHKHHIIPKHEWRVRFGNLKGFNASDNVVWLTLEQHAEVHKWLWEQYNSKLDWLAWSMLSGKNISCEEARVFAAKYRDTSYMQTPEYREKMAATKRGKIPFNKGIPMSLEQRLKCSEAAKKSLASIEHRKRLAELRRGIPRKLYIKKSLRSLLDSNPIA